LTGTLIDTDILIIGAGSGGLLAALSAKRNGPPGTRVAIADTWLVGRTGHTAFSNAWSIVVFPDDDLEATAREIIAGNDWVADQSLVMEVLATSYDRLRDLEGLELSYKHDGAYDRKPTRGLDLARVMCPVGGGLEFCWRLRRALEAAGVQILDRTLVTGLMKGDGDRVVGAVGIHGRTGEFRVMRAKATIIATNAITFRPGFARDITGTGTLLAYKAGAALRNGEFSYLRPGTPKFYFEGITHAIQEGARFRNAKGETFMARHEPDWADEADVPRIARAMAVEFQQGNAPLYLDMSGIPAAERDHFIRGKVKWMEMFFSKLGSEARTDMFGNTPYFPMNQMTKMGVRTGADCRSDVPGLLAAGLAQAGCANHFAGFHIGMCIGTGWIAGRSAVEDVARLPDPRLDAAEVRALQDETFKPLDQGARADSDRLLRDLQALMFRYDVMIWKHADRLAKALARLAEMKAEFASLHAPHTHELVRLKETEAMFLAAELMLRSSASRTESRMSHFREDFDFRDDKNWLAWVDVRDKDGAPATEKTPIPTPIHPITAARNVARRKRRYVAEAAR